MRSSSLVALAASLASVSAVYQGFNYGSTNSDGSPKTLQQFTDEFTTAKNLVGTSGFTSARLYTSIQGGSSTNQPIEAIQAGINTGTSLLLGVWASGGQAGISAEIIALKAAITQFGLTKAHVAGLSVGSEDLYRISPTGIAAKSGYGADPATIVDYIGQIRTALTGTALEGVSIGHVDTWTAWVNGSNSAVIDAVDWVGVDAYPYFQNTQSNAIESNSGLFNDAYSATVAVSKGKDVWITETGFSVSGPTENLAVPSVPPAKTYWDEVGCPRFGKVNTYWYTLFDAPSAPSFGIVGNTLSTTPLFDLSCAAIASSSSIAVPTSTSSTVSVPPVVVPSPSTAAASTTTTHAATTVSTANSVAVPTLVSSGGGLAPTIPVPIILTTKVVTPTTTASSASSAVPTTITTIVGGGNTTTASVSFASTTAAATSSIHTAGASYASAPAMGGALAAVVAFMAAM